MMATQRNPQSPAVALTEAQARARRQRNIAIGIVVALFCAMFYAVTLVKLGAFAGRHP